MNRIHALGERLQPVRDQMHAATISVRSSLDQSPVPFVAETGQRGVEGYLPLRWRRLSPAIGSLLTGLQEIPGRLPLSADEERVALTTYEPGALDAYRARLAEAEGVDEKFVHDAVIMAVGSAHIIGTSDYRYRLAHREARRPGSSISKPSRVADRLGIEVTPEAQRVTWAVRSNSGRVLVPPFGVKTRLVKADHWPSKVPVIARPKI